MDLASFVLLALAGFTAISGGLRFRIGFVRLSLTSPGRLALLAAIVVVVRHAAAPVDPIYRDFPRRLAAWARTTFRDDLDVRAPEPLTARLVASLIGLFTLLTALMTYPLVLRMTDSVFDPGDPLLNAWALKWVAHQVVASPMHLFDGNIFAPERNTLAYSETLLAPGLIAAPLSWLGAGGILVHNVVFFAGFVASGVGATLLVRDLTTRTSAALVSGIAFAFLPFRFDHFAQLQLQQAQWIPFAMWALHRILRTGRARDGVWLGVALSAQLLSCMYYGIFLALYLGVVGAWLLVWRLRSWRRWTPALVAAVVTALGLFAPAGKAYVDAREVVGERGREENVSFSATWRNFLAAPDTNRLYGRTAARFGGLERDLFPGIVLTIAALMAVWPPLSVTRAAYGLGLLFAVDLSLGFNGFAYPILYDAVPVLRALRIPALAVVLIGFSLSVLGGFGAARLRVRGAIPVLCAAILFESLSTPMPLTALPTSAPEVYADLLEDGGGPSTIVELPMIYSRDPNYQDQIYMYYSTFHWQTLVNGYSGFFPPSYLEAAAVMRTFPDARSLAALKARNVRYVVVHGERMAPDTYQQVVDAADRCACGLTPVSRRPWQNREIRLYRLQ